MLIKYFGLERCELTTKSVDKVLETISSVISAWKSLINSGFLSEGMNEKYLELVDVRLRSLNFT